jgi:hypothetical protein
MAEGGEEPPSYSQREVGRKVVGMPQEEKARVVARQRLENQEELRGTVKVSAPSVSIRKNGKVVNVRQGDVRRVYRRDERSLVASKLNVEPWEQGQEIYQVVSPMRVT